MTLTKIELTLSRWCALLLLTVVVGCAGGPQTPDEPVVTERTSQVESNGAAYSIELTLPPTVTARSPFDLGVRVLRPDDASPISVAVGARLRSGAERLPRRPIVRDLGDRNFRVEGLRFPRAGFWELYVDTTSGAHTERTQIDLEVAETR